MAGLSRGAKQGNFVPVPTEPSHEDDAPPEPQAGAVIRAIVRPAGDEAFLPWLREDLQRMCLEDGKLSPEEATLFERFCSLFYTYLHLDFYERLKSVDAHYAHFDPDRDTKPISQPDREAEDGVSRVVGCFRELAERSNYFEVSPAMIARCLEEVTLIDLKTKVDLDDFEQVVCYARGDIHAETTVRKLWKTRKIKMDVLQRVVLLLKYKDAEYFEKDRPAAQGGAPLRPDLYLLLQERPQIRPRVPFPQCRDRHEPQGQTPAWRPGRRRIDPG